MTDDTSVFGRRFLVCTMKHVATIVAVTVFVIFACAYANPYSLHRFIVATPQQFDTPVDSEGVAQIGSRAIDFRMPLLTLAPESVLQLRKRLEDDSKNDLQTVREAAKIVRQSLGGIDRSKPPASGQTQSAATFGELLYRNGNNFHCLCSDYARLMVEILQAGDIVSRVLWLEGHVVCEYFDTDLNNWVYIDPQWNVMFISDDGLLSASGVVSAAEDRRPLPWKRIIEDEFAAGATSPSFADVDRAWYLGVLGNGECYAESGSTLLVPGRWSHLLRFFRRPAVLVMVTGNDPSAAKHVESLNLRKCLLLILIGLLGHYSLARFRAAQT